LLQRERDERSVDIADRVTDLRIEVRDKLGDLGWRYVCDVDCHNERYHASTTRLALFERVASVSHHGVAVRRTPRAVREERSCPSDVQR
jgi:hypothetical protein